jgi:hypothetical protein
MRKRHTRASCLSVEPLRAPARISGTRRLHPPSPALWSRYSLDFRAGIIGLNCWPRVAKDRPSEGKLLACLVRHRLCLVAGADTPVHPLSDAAFKVNGRPFGPRSHSLSKCLRARSWQTIEPQASSVVTCLHQSLYDVCPRFRALSIVRKAEGGFVATAKRPRRRITVPMGFPA